MAHFSGMHSWKGFNDWKNSEIFGNSFAKMPLLIRVKINQIAKYIHALQVSCLKLNSRFLEVLKVPQLSSWDVLKTRVNLGSPWSPGDILLRNWVHWSVKIRVEILFKVMISAKALWTIFFGCVRTSYTIKRNVLQYPKCQFLSFTSISHSQVWISSQCLYLFPCNFVS